MEESNTEKVALTPGEFASYFGKSQTWGYRQLYSGKVKALTGYGRIMIPFSEVERLLEEAGRYLGVDTKIKEVEDSNRPVIKDDVKPISWRNTLKKRRTVNGKVTNGTNQRINSSAVQKMNRTKKV